MKRGGTHEAIAGHARASSTRPFAARIGHLSCCRSLYRGGDAIRTGCHGVVCDHLAKLVRSVYRAAADHPFRHALRDPRCAGAPVSWAEDGAKPRGIVAREPGWQNLRIQAASRIEISQWRRANDGGREVQLRTVLWRIGQNPEGACG